MFESLLETLKSYSLVGPIVVAAPIALFVAFYFNWWRNRKSLSYEILTSTNLFSVNSDVKHRIKITLDGKSAKDVQIVIIKILNDGYLPIENKDFSTPLIIDFGENAEIISVENKENNPEDLPVEFTFEKTKIEIEPLLLNRKDSFKIQVLVNDFESILKVAARVKGIQKIENASISSNFFFYVAKQKKLDVFFPLLIFSLISPFVLIKFQESDFFTLVLLLIIPALCVLLIFGEYYTYRKTRKNK